MIGKFTNLKNYQPYLVIDDAAGCDEVLNNTIYCGYPLSPNGNKMLIFLLESINVNFSSYQVYGLANRIIIRDNQTFMNDNAAFTLANKCQTFNNPYDPARGLSISTTACCTEFQAVISTTTMGSSTTTSSSSPGTSPSTTNTQMPPSSSSSPASPSPASSSPPSTSPTSAGSKTFEHSNFVLSFFALIISFFMIKA
uniref:Uncharacterized protein n=1 Tax=Panagrolaimus superbus TaxID=310955 RepID=A0A914XZI2_9BILA